MTDILQARGYFVTSLVYLIKKKKCECLGIHKYA